MDIVSWFKQERKPVPGTCVLKTFLEWIGRIIELEMSKSGLNLHWIWDTAPRKQPDGQDQAWHLVWALVFPMNMDDFKAHHYRTRPLCDWRIKDTRLLHHCLNTDKNRNTAQNTKMTKHPLVLANMSHCCFFINMSFSPIPFFPSSK